MYTIKANRITLERFWSEIFTIDELVPPESRRLFRRTSKWFFIFRQSVKPISLQWQRIRSTDPLPLHLQCKQMVQRSTLGFTKGVVVRFFIVQIPCTFCWWLAKSGTLLRLKSSISFRVIATCHIGQEEEVYITWRNSLLAWIRGYFKMPTLLESIQVYTWIYLHMYWLLTCYGYLIGIRDLFTAVRSTRGEDLARETCREDMTVMHCSNKEYQWVYLKEEKLKITYSMNIDCARDSRCHYRKN